jgi:hypothetical protein
MSVNMSNSGVPRNFVWVGSANSVEERGQIEWGFGGSAQFTNE